MSTRRQTVAEARFPDEKVFQALISRWSQDATVHMLESVWAGYDLLVSEVLSQIHVLEADEDLERNITQLLEPRIRSALTGDEPYEIQHGSYEEESRQPPPAQPPQYDLAFVLRANPRIMWPLEAKVIRTKGDVSRYVREITDNFLTCRYAPFSREGAMLGYVLVKDTESVFRAIAKSVPCTMIKISSFANRPHKQSRHSRAVPPGKRYAGQFSCHHLLMVLV